MSAHDHVDAFDALFDDLALIDGSLQRWEPISMRAEFLMRGPGGKAVWVDMTTLSGLAAEQPMLRAQAELTEETAEQVGGSGG